jgi:competence protein ComEC
MIFSIERLQMPIYRPLVPMTVAIIMGIALGTCFSGYFEWALAAFLTMVPFVWLHVLRQQWTIVLPLLVCVGSGYISIQAWLSPDLPNNHVLNFADQGYLRIYGVVSQSPKNQNGRWKFELSAHRIVKKHNAHNVCGRVWVTGRGDWPGAKIGDSVVFRGRLRTIRNFSNPGGFDYKRFMALERIHVRVYASANSFKIESAAPVGGLIQRMDKLRNKLSFRLDTVLSKYKPQTVGLVKALIFGERSGISSTLRADFNRAGVGHVMAISGLHVGMVATLSFAAAYWIMAWIPLLLKFAWVRKTAAAISFVPVLGYGFLAGLSPSTQRAMLMVTFCLMGIWVGRRHDWLNSLALAALVILVIYPPALLSISFQLSFTAVLALILGAHLIPPVGSFPDVTMWKRMGHRIISFLWISILAILGTLPLVLHYFNQISLIGLAANLAVVPLVGTVVVPAGLLGTVGELAGIELGGLFWHAAAWGAQIILWVVQHASSWSWAAVKGVTPNGFEIGLYYLFGAIVLFWKKWPHRALTLAVIVTLCAADAGYWIYQRYGRKDLRVTAIDVGQGGANLLELPKGFTILVDGGGFSDNNIFDVGDAVIAPLLWQKKITTIDLVVLSHANSDHLNGLLYILEYFDVGEVWSNQEPATTKGYARWSKLLADRNILHMDFDQLPRRVVRNGVQLEILAPPADFLEGQQASWRDLNNNSLVLRVCFGDISFLFSGDIEKPGEADLVSRVGHKGLQSTVLLVPHHGSRNSSTMAFLRAVNSREAIISAGWQNRFNFPHEEVLKRLERAGSRIWCTAHTGALEVSTDGISYQIGPHRPVYGE